MMYKRFQDGNAVSMYNSPSYLWICSELRYGIFTVAPWKDKNCQYAYSRWYDHKILLVVADTNSGVWYLRCEVNLSGMEVTSYIKLKIILNEEDLQKRPWLLACVVKMYGRRSRFQTATVMRSKYLCVFVILWATIMIQMCPCRARRSGSDSHAEGITGGETCY